MGLQPIPFSRSGTCPALARPPQGQPSPSIKRNPPPPVNPAPRFFAPPHLPPPLPATDRKTYLIPQRNLMSKGRSTPRNSKHEARNPKQAPMTQNPNASGMHHTFMSDSHEATKTRRNFGNNEFHQSPSAACGRNQNLRKRTGFERVVVRIQKGIAASHSCHLCDSWFKECL